MIIWGSFCEDLHCESCCYDYVPLCSLCRVELAVQFPAREVLLLVCCGWDTSYIVLVHVQYQTSIYTRSWCRRHSWRVRLAKQETLTPPGHLVSPLLCRGPWIFTVVLYCWCHSDGASVLLYFTFLSHLFPLPCGASSTVPREGLDSIVIMPYSRCVVTVHRVSSLHIYTFVVSRAFMADSASQAGDAGSARAPGLTSDLQGSVNVHRGALLLVPQWRYISSFVFYSYVLFAGGLLGCYEDKRKRILEQRKYNDKGNTVEKCKDRCFKLRKKFAGVEVRTIFRNITYIEDDMCFVRVTY